MAAGPTGAQAAVIDLDRSARALVIAGPGTGKTWTLLARAGALVQDQGVQTADILVLSFTRAVVRELRKRDRDSAFVSRIRPETFDAFATRILAECVDGDSWRANTFDARIEAATLVLEAGRADDMLAEVQHVLLDEVQDLVGPRGRFVAALLERMDCGFTAFGDPAQAIYDHERGRQDDGFFEQMRDALADEIHHLEGNFRAAGELAELAEDLRGGLLDRGGNSTTAVDAAFGGLDTLGELDDLPTHLSSLSGNCAVLCRDNATALLLSRALFERGVSHHVRQGTADRPVAGWVAAVFGANSTLGRRQLEDRHTALAERRFPGLPGADEAWATLSRLDPRARGGAIRASEVGSRVAVGRVPWELYDEQDHRLIVSSVHRSKGLEFDLCTVVEWSVREEQDADLEARVLFVALTRARRDCFHVNGLRRKRWYRSAEARDRFIKFGRENWQTFGIEVRGDDVHNADPAGELALGVDAAEIQRTLAEDVRPGDEVTLELLGEHDFGFGQRPIYAVQHALGPIGVTGDALGTAIRGRCRRGAPARIDKVRVLDLETVKGSVETSDAAGLGRSGLWLRPRLVGLGDFAWQ